MAEMSNPVDVMGRELPYSQEAELAVIGSALTNLHSVAESVEILRPSDFYFPCLLYTSPSPRDRG